MMTPIRSSKLVGPVGIMIAMIMLAALVPTSVLPHAQAQGQSRLLLLFPVIDGSDSGHEDVTTRMTAYLEMALNQTRNMKAAEFSRTNPLVLRAVEEGQIRAVDLDTEVRDPITAVQLGYALNADEVCLATITSIDVSEEPLEVELLLNGQCYDVAANIDEETMQVAENPEPSNTFGVSGTSNVREGYDASIQPLIREAMKSAASAAASVLSREPAEEAAVKKEKRDDKSWRWIVAAALIAGLIVASESGGDGGDQPADEALPPRPLDVEIEPSAIELFWAPPDTTLTLLRYDLQRSTDRGATWNPVPNSQGNILPDDTVFADFDVMEDQSYRYRIRAQYTTTGPSPWVEFGDVQFPG
ncbi:MAG: hypothetical protein ACOC7J_03210 [Armatimonadota bacterium]